MRRRLMFALASLALAGCAAELGEAPPNTGFGETMARNEAAQGAASQAAAYVAEARARFASEAPVVVYYSFNRSAPDAEGRAALDAQARWLKANPALRVRIAGHADLVGGEGYNDGLGLNRARAAAARLVLRGVAPERIEAVESRGERAPLVENDGPERLNRRTVTDIAGLAPGVIGDGLDGRRGQLAYDRYATDTVTEPASADTATGGVAIGGGAQ